MEPRIVLPTVAIYVTDEEAKRFVMFQKHYAIIGLLDSVGAFDIKSGSIKLNFNDKGMISTIEKNEVYRQ